MIPAKFGQYSGKFRQYSGKIWVEFGQRFGQFIFLFACHNILSDATCRSACTYAYPNIQYRACEEKSARLDIIANNMFCSNMSKHNYWQCFSTEKILRKTSLSLVHHVDVLSLDSDKIILLSIDVVESLTSV